MLVLVDCSQSEDKLSRIRSIYEEVPTLGNASLSAEEEKDLWTWRAPFTQRLLLDADLFIM